MKLKIPSNKWKVIIIVFLILYFFSLSYRANKFYDSVFRLSFDQVQTVLKDEPLQCKKIADCNLMPGDIIIRRYITNTIFPIDEMFDIYFTHSAFYLGNDKLFEVLGSKEKTENQIMITELSKSDWMNIDMKNFVIIRPKNYNGKLDYVIKKLINIAEDPEYVFGPLNESKKTASCADVILKYLLETDILKETNNTPQIITPDYLFWITTKNSNFDVIGFNIEPKI